MAKRSDQEPLGLGDPTALLPPPLFMSPAKKDASASFCRGVVVFPSALGDVMLLFGVLGSGLWYVCRSCLGRGFVSNGERRDDLISDVPSNAVAYHQHRLEYLPY